MSAKKSTEKGEKETRCRNWTFVLYEDSAPVNWRDILDDEHIEWIESPWHDKDVNANGEPKKKHKHIALLYAVVISVGVYLGKIKIGGISLGVTFVLFAGIVAGHLHFTAPTEIMTFMQDFGLILFVFMIGLQVGPGFFSSFGTVKDKIPFSYFAFMSSFVTTSPT